MSAEEERLRDARERTAHWKRWGPYLAERAWGTVREDYSEDGSAWEYFTFEQSRSRAYRWNEDGLLGICDRRQILCFALALWNHRDPILKERAFGLGGKEGNHGEDVKEEYFYLDSTPTHSYCKALYRYPQSAFPYAALREPRGRDEPELKLADTGAFDQGWFDVFVEYAKPGTDDVCIRIEVVNRGASAAPLTLLPTLWYRNTWSWTNDAPKPSLAAQGDAVVGDHPHTGRMVLTFEGAPALLFCDNESNDARLWNEPGPAFPKDGIGDHVVEGAPTVNPLLRGTKCAARYELVLAPGASAVVRLRLAKGHAAAVDEVDAWMTRRRAEADEFYASVIPARLSPDAREVMRRSLAGMLWSKQFYHYVVRDWLKGDPAQPRPPPSRRAGRNAEWTHLFGADVLSMPDKWEYPWFAAWDLAFHCIPLALVDSDFAKEQLLLLTREWYMHPNGQLPAYEWGLDDVNPPVLAWAAWRVYKMERKRRGTGDRKFLKRMFHKLMLNFTWWVNRKDAEGRNVFQGGFLGLDNIGVFDRSKPLPGGGHLEQSDGTSWMAMYSLNLLTIALELAREEDEYEDVASKFWEHFVHIARALNTMGLWDEEDGFFYDVLHRDGEERRLRIRSMVGLVPLFAVEPIAAEIIRSFPAFARRLEWFIDNRADLTEGVADMRAVGASNRRLFAVVAPDKLRRVLARVFDEDEFLSPHGIRGLSRVHRDQPYSLQLDGHLYSVEYEPGESRSGLFGGNSNWRGPVWFPVNYLLIESLQKFHHYLGDSFQIEFPTRSGRLLTLEQIAAELSRRLAALFLLDERGVRPALGAPGELLFHEYFHGDTGRGLGAAHQTGWTGLVAKLLQQSGE